MKLFYLALAHLAVFLRLSAFICLHWPLILAVIFFAAPAGPHVNMTGIIAAPNARPDCVYLGARGLRTRPYVMKCPLSIILPNRQ